MVSEKIAKSHLQQLNFKDSDINSIFDICKQTKHIKLCYYTYIHENCNSHLQNQYNYIVKVNEIINKYVEIFDINDDFMLNTDREEITYKLTEINSNSVFEDIQSKLAIKYKILITSSMEQILNEFYINPFKLTNQQQLFKDKIEFPILKPTITCKHLNLFPLNNLNCDIQKLLDHHFPKCQKIYNQHIYEIIFFSFINKNTYTLTIQININFIS